MGNNLKFEFSFDEVFEGIKQGVIRELSETNFDIAKDQVVEQLKSEIKNKIYIAYKDENELKDEIKNEIKDKVFYKLLDEARKEYEKHYEDLFNKKILLEVEKTEKEIKTKTINRLYDDLYSGIQYEVSEKIQSVVARLANNLIGNNVKINDTEDTITKAEYDSLIHNSEVLEALEQGGVDNWEWYGESISQYFGDEGE